MDPIAAPAAGTNAPATAAGAVAPAAPAPGGVIGSAGEAAAATGADPKQAAAPAVDPKKDAVASPAELNIKLPEGFKADEKVLAAFKAVAKELNLNSEGAQKLVDFNAKLDKERLAVQDQLLDQQEKAWEKEIAEDKEFGGNNLVGTKAAIGRLLQKFDTPDKAFRNLVGHAGFGSNPVAVRFLAKIALAMKEDSVGGGTQPTGVAKKSIDDPAFLRGLFNNTKRPES